MTEHLSDTPVAEVRDPELDRAVFAMKNNLRVRKDLANQVAVCLAVNDMIEAENIASNKINLSQALDLADRTANYTRFLTHVLDQPPYYPFPEGGPVDAAGCISVFEQVIDQEQHA